MLANDFFALPKTILCRKECPFYHEVPEQFRGDSNNPNDYIGCSYKNIVKEIEYIESTLLGAMCHHSEIFENRGLISELFDIVSG